MVSKPSQEFYASVFSIGMLRLKNEKEDSSEMFVTTYDTTRYHNPVNWSYFYSLKLSNINLPQKFDTWQFILT
jgi:hypothetical protein